MASRIKTMTEGKPASLIFAFAMPLMVGNIFQQLYTVVDTMVVGKALGVNALAALGAADWMNWMMLGMIQGITQGFGILMAQEFGAGKYKDLCKTVPGSGWHIRFWNFWIHHRRLLVTRFYICGSCIWESLL